MNSTNCCRTLSNSTISIIMLSKQHFLINRCYKQFLALRLLFSADSQGWYLMIETFLREKDPPQSQFASSLLFAAACLLGNHFKKDWHLSHWLLPTAMLIVNDTNYYPLLPTPFVMRFCSLKVGVPLSKLLYCM